MLLHFLYLSCKKIIITPYDEFDKHLSIVGNKVRMINSNDGNDEFSIRTGLTSLKQGDNYICGKELDPGVILCSDEYVKSLFRFSRYSDYIKIVSEDGLCLTIRGIDNVTNGNYLNLLTCEDNDNQKFRYFRVMLTGDPEKDGTYKLMTDS